MKNHSPIHDCWILQVLANLLSTCVAAVSAANSNDAGNRCTDFLSTSQWNKNKNQETLLLIFIKNDHHQLASSTQANLNLKNHASCFTPAVASQVLSNSVRCGAPSSQLSCSTKAFLRDFPFVTVVALNITHRSSTKRV
jgi:hypothetical protein